MKDERGPPTRLDIIQLPADLTPANHVVLAGWLATATKNKQEFLLLLVETTTTLLLAACFHTESDRVSGKGRSEKL